MTGRKRKRDVERCDMWIYISTVHQHTDNTIVKIKKYMEDGRKDG